MFNDHSTSEDRFYMRIRRWKLYTGGSALGHHWWWFVHNCIAHPAIGLCPTTKTFQFHDWTSVKINGDHHRDKYVSNKLKALPPLKK